VLQGKTLNEITFFHVDHHFFKIKKSYTQKCLSIRPKLSSKLRQITLGSGSTFRIRIRIRDDSSSMRIQQEEKSWERPHLIRQPREAVFSRQSGVMAAGLQASKLQQSHI
jgi:hypothetical protein